LQDNIDILAVSEEYKEKMEKNIVKMKGMDFMSITVRKATEADINKLKNNPTWGCEAALPQGNFSFMIVYNNDHGWKLGD